MLLFPHALTIRRASGKSNGLRFSTNAHFGHYRAALKINYTAFGEGGDYAGLSSAVLRPQAF